MPHTSRVVHIFARSCMNVVCAKCVQACIHMCMHACTQLAFKRVKKNKDVMNLFSGFCQIPFLKSCVRAWFDGYVCVCAYVF